MNKTISIKSATILATAVIPWTKRYEFDEAIFSRQVETISDNLTPFIYIFGTAGEGYAVNETQFDQISSAFWRCSKIYGVYPILGIISLSLSTTINRIERGYALGFRDFQLSLPSWGELNDCEVDTFFAETCGRFCDCNFHHYNLLRTKRLLTSVDYLRLTAAHPNLVSVKAGGRNPAVFDDLLTVSPRLRLFFTEVGYEFVRRTRNDVGLLISLASANYHRAKAFVEGDKDQRATDIVSLNSLLSNLKEITSSRKLHIDGVYDKMLYRLTDNDFPLRLLPPYDFATENEFEQFRASIPNGW